MADDESDFYTGGTYGDVAISAQGGLAGRLFHGQIERGLGRDDYYPRVLEIGALTGQHLPFVRHRFDEWILMDILPSVEEHDDPRVRFVQGDVAHMDFTDGSFDRVAMTCVLHHLADPMSALRETRRVCRTGGRISILLPIDPYLPYKLSLEVTSMRRARRLGHLEEARRARALGHRNHYDSLKWQLQDVFAADDVHVGYWPIPWPGRFANIFTAWQIDKKG